MHQKCSVTIGRDNDTFTFVLKAFGNRGTLSLEDTRKECRGQESSLSSRAPRADFYTKKLHTSTYRQVTEASTNKRATRRQERAQTTGSFLNTGVHHFLDQCRNRTSLCPGRIRSGYKRWCDGGRGYEGRRESGRGYEGRSTYPRLWSPWIKKRGEQRIWCGR